MLGILNRSILLELIKVFVTALIALTAIIVLAALVVEASQRGLGPAQILMAVPLLVPSMMPFIIPPTTLFATCIVYGRLSGDNEITAIKAAGIHLVQIVWPGVFLGLFASLLTLGLYYDLIPRTHNLLRTAVIYDFEEFLYSILRRDREICQKPELKVDYEIHVKEVSGRKLKDAIFIRRDSQGNYAFIATAREAELHVDLQKGTTGEVAVQLRNCHVVDEAGKNRGFFEEYVWNVPLPPLPKRAPSPRSMTWPQLWESMHATGEEEEQLIKQTDMVLTASQASESVATQAAHRQYVEHARRQVRQKLNSIYAEIHLRPALSFGCLFFVLVGCPVGILMSKSDYLSAFTSCFLPIAVIYYPLQLCTSDLARDGRLHPAVAMWLANAAIGLLALGLFRKLLKN